MKKIIILLLLSTQTYGFTLMYRPAQFFPNPEVTINFSSNTCTNTGLTTSQLLDLAISGVDRFWNAAATSSIKLKKGAVISAGIAGTEDFATVLAAATNQTILIACSSHATMTATTGGSGGIATDGKKGALIINNSGVSPLPNYSDALLETLMAHEIGHALGISHSADPAALMYYNLAGVREVLAEDDLDAITYLYPNESKLGCMGALGTLSDDKNNPSGPSWFLSLFLGLMLIFICKLKPRIGNARVFRSN